MSIGNTVTLPCKIVRWQSGKTESGVETLINEEPLSIRVQGNPYAVVMRTPGEEMAHAAGFCLAEGISDRPEDIRTLAFCDGLDTNTVTVTLTPERALQIADHLDRRSYISQTSCGICGKSIVEELSQTLRPISDGAVVPLKTAYEKLVALSRHQPLRNRTRATHAAVLYSADFELMSAAEDVGRHNAVDKAIGKLFLDGRLDAVKLMTLSSRISYELVQKAARAGIPIILALSRPTKLAVLLAESLNMTLACQARKGELLVFCHGHRLTV